MTCLKQTKYYQVEHSKNNVKKACIHVALSKTMFTVTVTELFFLGSLDSRMYSEPSYYRHGNHYSQGILWVQPSNFQNDWCQLKSARLLQNLVLIFWFAEV